MIQTRSFLMALFICMMIFVCASLIGWSNHSQAASKMVWEYKIINTAVEPPQSPMANPERGLNQLGAEGWELVQFSRSEMDATQGMWIFKRAK